jgi:hypothetical protein
MGALAHKKKVSKALGQGLEAPGKKASPPHKLKDAIKKIQTRLRLRGLKPKVVSSDKVIVITTSQNRLACTFGSGHLLLKASNPYGKSQEWLLRNWKEGTGPYVHEIKLPCNGNGIPHISCLEPILEVFHELAENSWR